MSCTFDNTRRFNAAQIFFRKFVEQATRFKVDNFYGLVQFGISKGNVDWGVLQPLTALSSNFKNSLDSLSARGGTPMWEALELAVTLLVAKHSEVPKAPMRIIALTDGSANHDRTMDKVIDLMRKNNIRLDALLIGGYRAAPLMTAAHMTGGAAFSPPSIAAADPLFQNEAFFNPSLREFGPIIPGLSQSIHDQISSNRLQPRSTIEANPASAVRSGPFADPPWIVARAKPDTARDIRLVEELKYIIWNTRTFAEAPSFHVFVSQANLADWRVILRGPEGSLYTDRWFLLAITFPPLYPGNAPIIRFVYPPYHINVTDHGRILLPEIQEYYDETLHVFELVAEVRFLLGKERDKSHPNVDPHPVDDDHARVYANVQAYIQKVKEVNGKCSREAPEQFWGSWRVERLPAAEADPILGAEAMPRWFLCPISRRVMTEPVRSPTTDFFYERRVFQHLLESDSPVCPVTGKRLEPNRDSHLPIDTPMAQRIRAFLEQHRH
jgi:ubiquitin-protein ligase